MTHENNPDYYKLDAGSLEYAAKWIENSLIGETNERVIEFGKNMAMSIRAAKTSPSDVSMTQDVSIDIKTPSSTENTNPSILRKTDGCRGCYHSSRDHPGGAPGLIEHDPDCPITLHRQLVEKYGTGNANKVSIDCNGIENPVSDADITGRMK